MKIVRLSLAVMVLCPPISIADTRLYKADPPGNIQYNKPSFTIQIDGRIYETDPIDYRKNTSDGS
jgi:hypothetical protein